MRSIAVSILVLSAGVAAASSVAAQSSFFKDRERPSRFTLGGDLVMSQPRGEFSNNVGNGYGAEFTGLFHLDRRGFFSIRGDVGGVQYGRESQEIPFSPITGRVRLDLETTNQIAWGAIGTQLMIPEGPLRPYANASIAYTDFSTTSSLRGTDDEYEALSTQNQHDGSRAYIFGGGVLIPFGNRITSGALNLGGRYYYGGEATYLREGDITDNPDGTITLAQRRSRTDLVLWQVGVSFRLPHSRRGR
ncbi:MAG: hypothetical protein ACR2G6_15215 [Gemmatimonadaceae bacterium]